MQRSHCQHQPKKSFANTLRMNRRKKQWRARVNPNHEKVAQLRRQFPVSSGSEHRAIEMPGVPQPVLPLRLDDEYCSYPTPTPEDYSGAAPATPRFGLKMLQKMGWSPGEGLGKNKEGALEPLVPDGLYAQQDYQPKKQPVSLVDDLSAKHPVMALTELCTKYRWPQPKFEVVADSGPDHKKNFLMKVIVKGQEYKPSEAASSKKQAKANAAALFLESIGLYSKTKPSE